MQITHDLAIGGLQQVVVNLCKTIDRSKFDVSVLCLRRKGDFAPQIEKMGIKIFALPREPNKVDYLAFLKVAKILRQQKIEIIHTHNSEPFVDGTLGALLSPVKTIVHTDHGRVFPDKLKYMIHEWIVSQFAYKVVGVSQPTSTNLIKYEKISPKKITTIFNGIDGEKYQISVNKKLKKKELGLNGHWPILGTIGRLVPEKGIPYLLNAMPKLLTVFPKAKLLIIGDGFLQNHLKALVKESGLKNNVVFTGNRLDIPEVLNILDVFILSSISEGLPMVLLEALAAGCPIVATDVGGVSTAIKNGINGTLIDPKNSDLISSETLRLLQDRSLRDKYIENGLKLFRTKFAMKVMAKKYEQLYLRTDRDGR